MRKRSVGQRLFIYDSLPDPATHIRLLQLSKRNRTGQALHVDILTVLLHDAPPYHAISYTWGDPSSTEYINISDGRYLTVRSNCADVLRQLQHFQTTIYYWLDAICINQDDGHEKSYQVAMMGDIFERAECVLACVGEHHDDSDFLAMTLREFDEHLAAVQHSTQIFVRIPGMKNEWTDEHRWCIRHIMYWLEAFPDAATERLMRALDAFARRKYFWRIWILQEIYLAQSLRVFCGYDEILLPTLHFWWTGLKEHFMFYRKDNYDERTSENLLRRKLSPEYLEQARWTSVDEFLDFGGSSLAIEYEFMLQRAALPPKDRNERKSLPINKVHFLCEDRHCQDPRDSVYGTLALTSWGGIRAEYAKTTWALAKEVMQKNMVGCSGDGTLITIYAILIQMLRLGPEDEEVQEGIAIRSKQRAREDTKYKPRVGPEELSVMNNKRVKAVEIGFQLTHNSPWKFERTTLRCQNYVRILNEDGDCCAIACANTQLDDWICPTLNGRGLVLRRVGQLSMIVGKAFCLPASLPPKTMMSRLCIYFDIEDLVVHFAGDLRSQLIEGRMQFGEKANHDIDPPNDDLICALNISVCREPYSSYAELDNGQIDQVEKARKS